MKLKDLKLQHFGDFEIEENEDRGSLDTENPVAFFHNNEWHTGYFTVCGIHKESSYIFSEETLDTAFELSQVGKHELVFFNGFNDSEQVDIDYKELNPEMEVYPVEAVGSLAHEINQDKGQPQRAVMNYLLDQAKLLDMPYEEFLELIKDSAHQLLEDYKEEFA